MDESAADRKRLIDLIPPEFHGRARKALARVGGEPMTQPKLEGVETWKDLFAALRAAGYEKAAEFIESWQDEYLPGREDDRLPGPEWPRG